MAIIKRNPINVPVILTALSILQLKQMTRAIITSRIDIIYNQMLAAYTDLMAEVWANQKGLSPQEVLDGFEGEAAELFRLATILSTAINSATPDTVPTTAPLQTVLNSDGTVTVGVAE